MVDAAPDRVTGAENIVWDLSVLYTGPDDPALRTDMARIDAEADTFMQTYRGRIADLDATGLREAMQKYEAIYDAVARMESFASLSFSTATSDARVGALLQQIGEFETQIQGKLIFFDLEWNTVDDAKARAILADPTLGEYAHHLEARRRYKPHQLREEQEQIALEKDVVGVRAWQRFFTQLVSSLRYTLDGKELTQSEILTRFFEPDRDLRQRAAKSLTETLKSRLMELTYIFNTLTTNKAIDDRLRGYETWVSSRNLSNKAPDEVVDALVNTVTSNYDIVARHYRLKRAILGLDELHDYDRYAPLPTKESDTFYTWDEAKDIVLNAFNAFSPEMGAAAARFFDENWIHAAPMPDKRGGAFADPVTPTAHPYVFMTYNGTARDIMTLAHELGHGIHMLLSGEESSLFSLFTPLTTAETASTFAEMLVFQDLMARENDPEVRLSMIAQKIEDSFSTIFRQVAMNRFEDHLHNARRTEGELTSERIGEMWMDTQRAMFGDSVTLTDDYGVWWSYIPHFLYAPGYVYAYAFGELLVLALYQIYQEQGESFVPNYLDVLRAGNSDYPDTIMSLVDVDLNDPDFWQKGVDALSDLVDQEEALAKQVYPDRF